jgi:hypothetical protein
VHRTPGHMLDSDAAMEMGNNTVYCDFSHEDHT